MKNCLVLGSGRSGTSMLTGILHDAGYYAGDNLYPGRDTNPKGFFENAEINGINETILAAHDRATLWDRIFRRGRATVRAPHYGQRWLMHLPAQTDITNDDPDIARRIATLAKKEPFAYKDPRFSYTLPVWEKHLPENTVYICIFREPDVTVSSIMKEHAAMPYLHSLALSRKTAYDIWRTMYERILSMAALRPDRFVFVSYEGLYDRSRIQELSELLETHLSSRFIDKALKRSSGVGDAPSYVMRTYERLMYASEGS